MGGKVQEGRLLRWVETGRHGNRDELPGAPSCLLFTGSQKGVDSTLTRSTNSKTTNPFLPIT